MVIFIIHKRSSKTSSKTKLKKNPLFVCIYNINEQHITKPAHMPIEKPIQLCIPKVSNQITRNQIITTFQKLNIGRIYKIIENPLRADPLSKRIVISIEWDNTQPLAKEIQETLQDPTEHMNVVYEMPWYWQIYANHSQR